MGIAIADFNHDGYMDVFVANDTVRNFLYVNQKNGTFKEAGFASGVAYDEGGTTVSAMGCDAKDYDNDGLVDVFYNNLMGQIWALFRASRNGFSYASGTTQIARLSGCTAAASRSFEDGQTLFAAGDRDMKFFVVQAGEVEIIDYSGDEPRRVTVHHKGEFTGDVTHLTGGRAVVSAIARGRCKALEIPGAALRRVLGRTRRT